MVNLNVGFILEPQIKIVANMYCSEVKKIWTFLSVRRFRRPCLKGSPGGGVIVFVVGGTTFEEATAVTRMNEAAGEVRVLLGGSGNVVNSDAFLDVLEGMSDAASRARRR